ncbi:MAG: uncharacterized membrane protein YjjP (DUF1212 family) [Myxococcota bacterium]|jgi:uncharacterized membrane protein YjjP (DUF1212 family)
MSATRSDIRSQRLLTRLASCLHEAGAPAHRVEASFAAACSGLDVVGELFATPTSLTLTFGCEDQQTVRFVRVAPDGFDLSRLGALYSLADSVAGGSVGLDDLDQALQEILAAEAPFGADVELASWALVAASTAIFLGGGPAEMAAALCGGAAVGALDRLVTRKPRLAPLFEPVAAAFAAAIAALLVPALGGGAVIAATTSALIVLVPGFTLTVAMTEVATGHLASGTSRITQALATLVSLGFGAALGLAAVQQPLPVEVVQRAPAWLEWPALLLGALTFGVHFRVPARDLFWVVLAGVGAYHAALLGSWLLGPELGAFPAAALVAGGAHLFGRCTGRPPALVQVPGIMMLVPGSVGFRSMATMSGDVMGGVHTAFSMVMIAAALVAGLLAANVVLAAPVAKHS